MKRVGILALLCVGVVLAGGGAPAGGEDPPLTAILGAFDAEVALLMDEIADARSEVVLGITFTIGELRSRRVVLAETGVGKVNAAMTTTLLLDHFGPDEVIFTGIAGAVSDSVLPGDIVIAEKTAQHDLVVISEGAHEAFSVINPVDGKRNPVFFPSDDRLLRVAEEAASRIELDTLETSRGKRVPKVAGGIIVTGDAFIACSAKKMQLRQDFQADAVEMEGAAVSQVCYQQNVPCIVVRSLSDRGDEDASRDLEKFYEVAAHNSATLVVKIVELLAESE